MFVDENASPAIFASLRVGVIDTLRVLRSAAHPTHPGLTASSYGTFPRACTILIGFTASIPILPSGDFVLSCTTYRDEFTARTVYTTLNDGIRILAVDNGLRKNGARQQSVT